MNENREIGDRPQDPKKRGSQAHAPNRPIFVRPVTPEGENLAPQAAGGYGGLPTSEGGK